MDIEWIRQALKDRHPEKTQAGLAEALGIHASAVNRMLKGNRKLQLEEVSKVEAYFSEITPKVELIPKFEESARPLHYAPLINQTDWPRDLPAYGVVTGGTEGGIDFNGQVVDYLRRPPRLQGVKDAYAVYVHGDSMVPWRRNGEAVYVHPGLPCRIGDYVVVQLRPESDGAPIKAFIKELVRRTERDLRLKQFNPPKEITIPMAKVLAIHRVVDWTDLLGV